MVEAMEVTNAATVMVIRQKNTSKTTLIPIIRINDFNHFVIKIKRKILSYDFIFCEP